jgi:hemerythrin superfamily protein
MAQTRVRTRGKHDVVQLLLDQHVEIRKCLAEVSDSRGEPRRHAFQRLGRLMAAHETAEEMVLHPRARASIPGGPGIIADRLREEREAKELMASLDAMNPDDPEFDTQFALLQQMVLDHASQEEREEFPAVRQYHSEEQLRAMAMLVRAAEAVAPTHAHPGMESATANLLVGPAIAVADRVRDAITAAMSRGHADES